MALSILLYKSMFSVFGLESQLPYQLLNYALSGLVAALLFALAVPTGAPPPRRRGSCVSLVPRGAAAAAEALIEFDSGGVAYDSAKPVEVAIGRFSDLPSASLPARAGATRIEVPPTDGPTPWKIGIKATAPTLVCPAAA